MSHAPTAALDRRLTAVRERCRALGLDALVVTALPNILYLTNFTGSSAIVVVTPAGVLFMTDFRYVTALEASRGTTCECPSLELVVVDGSYDGKLVDVLAALSGGRVGFEGNHLTVTRHAWLVAALSASAGPKELTPTDGIVEAGRLVKDAYEIGVLREAGRRLAAAVPGIIREVCAGRTEREVAMAIDWRIRQAGFERTAFETIVAGGPNGALPHAHPGERTFIEGDLVVLDFGGVYDSYCVDLTRTVCVGKASARAREVYGAVRLAHDRAIQAVAPGRSPFDIDAAARQTLAEYGLDGVFGHGTGHGLGIEVHEAPRVTKRRPASDGRDEVVQPGMVFTIEPGAYLPQWGGVRIEDDVLVTRDGVEVLTDVTTELIEV